MRILNLASDIALATDAQSTGVDLQAQNAPFAPGYSAIVAVSLDAAADVTITVVANPESDFTGTDTILATVDLDGAAAKSGVVFFAVELSEQYIRVENVEGTTGAGTASVWLLGN